MTNLEITAPDAEYLEIREIFAHRGENAEKLPVAVLEVPEAQVYADSTEPEEGEKPFLERIRQRFRKMNPNAAVAGAGVSLVVLMAANVVPLLYGGGILLGLGCYAMGLQVPWKMS